MPNTKNLVGPSGQLYGEVTPGKDETQFQQDNTSSQYYNSVYYTNHKNQVQPIPPPRAGAAMQLSLEDFVDSAVMSGIKSAKQITFHAVGDTGAAKVSKSQTAATAIVHEASIADAMAHEVESGGANPPAFFFHLGDIIYNFGEGKYYYDQFFEPFRGYDRPIFAVPGNHDGMVFGDSADVPQTPTLVAFLRNFCSVDSGPSPDAGGLVRSVMTQPGVFFTLDTPYVSIIGLYSNVLDGPGVISSQGGHYPVSDDQLAFLESELSRLKPAREAGKQGIILALHHPPLSVDGHHGGSTGPSSDIDSICTKVGLWPDLVLSGHAHLYQRFTRRVGSRQIPYIVSGSGGFAATPPQTKAPPAPFTIGDQTLEVDPIVKFGYLNITASATEIKVLFRCPTVFGVQELDSVTVELGSGTISQGASAPAPSKAKPTGTKNKKPPTKPRHRPGKSA
jgi:hypothetical protein